MTTALDDPIVVDYLATLDRLLDGAPDRGLVLDGVRHHIDDALSTGPADPARIRAVLDELGDPAVIAAESTRPTPRPARGLLERRSGAIITVLLLAIGGVVVPVIGWVIGLVLLWTSRGWTVLDKLVGTFGPLVVASAAFGVALLLPATSSYHHLALIVGLGLGMIAAAVYLLLRFRPRT